MQAAAKNEWCVSPYPSLPLGLHNLRHGQPPLGHGQIRDQPLVDTGAHLTPRDVQNARPRHPCAVQREGESCREGNVRSENKGIS